MIFEKIREKIREKIEVTWKNDRKDAFNDAIDIINQVEAEYNNDIVYQLAMKYALCLTQYGVDITEKLETATQNVMALEQAYIRGRQDECDRFSEWRDRHNNGWIPCSERLPKYDEYVLCQGKNSQFIACIDSLDNKWKDGHFYVRTNITHWQPLPQPPKGE